MHINKLRDHQFNNDKTIKFLEEKLNDGNSAIHKLRVSCVAIRDGENWRNALLLFRFLLEGDRQIEEREVFYDDIRFHEFYTTPKHIFAFIEQMRQGSIELNGQRILLGSANEFYNRVFIQKENEYSKHQGNFISASNRNQVSIPYDVLIAHNKPYYKNIYHAIENKIGIKLNNSDARLFTTHIFIPEDKAEIFIEAYEEENNKLLLTIKRRTEEAFFIRGVYEVNGDYREIEEATKDNNIDIEFGEDRLENIRDFEVFMLDINDNIIDHIYADLLITKQYSSIEELLAVGEGETVEYKMYIRIKETDKLQDIYKTTIAFANSSGGNILIGINDYVDPVGIDKGITSDPDITDPGIEAKCDKYIILLKKYISDNINDSIQIESDKINYKGIWLIHLFIHKGLNTPYADKSNNIWIRKGSSNKKADPKMDLKNLVK
ncbi:ATP-binding protein [candidate division TA06 bacterium]|nr:ATP-binding protein [candidate division TA06 bacterium]